MELAISHSYAYAADTHNRVDFQETFMITRNNKDYDELRDQLLNFYGIQLQQTLPTNSSSISIFHLNGNYLSEAWIWAASWSEGRFAKANIQEPIADSRQKNEDLHPLFGLPLLFLLRLLLLPYRRIQVMVSDHTRLWPCCRAFSLSFPLPLPRSFTQCDHGPSVSLTFPWRTKRKINR